MNEDAVSRVPVWQIPRLDPGYIYFIEAGQRLKIGKSADRGSRIRAAKTWLPDMTLVGVKPFWNVGQLERDIHHALAQWWYDGEWFDMGNEPYREDILLNFCAFSDNDAGRDMNSVNFIYWMHEFADLFAQRPARQSLRAFQREISDIKKTKK